MGVKRLQIMIDEDLDAELQRRASAERRSKAALIRESLRRTLRPLPPLEADPLSELTGACEFQPAHHDEIVYDG